MICPACKNKLTEIELGDITLDICKNRCGGIWFDWHEMKKFDEPHETAGQDLLNIPINPKIVINHSEKRQCPRCDEKIIMVRHFSSTKKEIELDECGNCGGFWLDAGELNHHRGQFATDEERENAAKKHMTKLLNPLLKEKRKQTKEKLQKTKEIISVFKYICPSYYIPKEQDWSKY